MDMAEIPVVATMAAVISLAKRILKLWLCGCVVVWLLGCGLCGLYLKVWCKVVFGVKLLPGFWGIWKRKRKGRKSVIYTILQGALTIRISLVVGIIPG